MKRRQRTGTGQRRERYCWTTTHQNWRTASTNP